MKKLIIAIVAVLLVCFYSPQSPLDAAIERFQNHMEYRFSEEQLRFITYWSRELKLNDEEDIYQFIVDTSAFHCEYNAYSKEYINYKYLQNGTNNQM